MIIFKLLLVGLLFTQQLIYAKDFIPAQAYKYNATILNEINTNFKSLPDYYYIPALIEHESCISLTHSKCWNPQSSLKTKREEGAGLGQLTRAYDVKGDLRFDTLTDLRTRYKDQLRELSWNTIYQRPDLQIRSITLMLKDSYAKLYDVNDTYQRLAMTDAAYNGGLRGVQADRRLCGLTRGCNPNIWFHHVEATCSKSTAPIYGNRSPCDINRHHVSDVMLVRLPKYQSSNYYQSLLDIGR